MKDAKIATKSVHAGYKAESGEPLALPIKQATTYRYYHGADVAALFDLESANYMYSRLGNPTVGALEEKLCALEGGTAAVATSSGQAATLCTVLNICQAGDHILSGASIYGGTYNLLDVTLRRFGIETDFIPYGATKEEIIKLAKPNTKLLFGETLANPALNILDFDTYGAAAKELNVPFVVDNTLATPALCRPFEHGANIVVHSTTKYSDGQGLAVGGILIENGSFDWNGGKYSTLTEPDESYPGLTFYDKFGPAAFCVRAPAALLRDFGCPAAPFNAWLTYQGLNTLAIRMEKHVANAQKVAEFLQRHDKVASVKYPGLPTDEDYENAQRYLGGAGGGVVCFTVKGGKAGGEVFQKNLDLISVAVHVGDLHSCVLHPASTTHRQLSESDQIAAGIDPGLVRYSVGLEDIDDILADLEKALAAV